MVLGFQRHRSPRIAALFAMGILGLLGARFLEEMEGHDGQQDLMHHPHAAHRSVGPAQTNILAYCIYFGLILIYAGTILGNMLVLF